MNAGNYDEIDSLGGLIAALYDAYLECYDDDELACLATATVINDILAAKPEDIVDEIAAPIRSLQGGDHGHPVRQHSRAVVGA